MKKNEKYAVLANYLVKPLLEKLSIPHHEQNLRLIADGLLQDLRKNRSTLVYFPVQLEFLTILQLLLFYY